jgi:lysophospholipid acyltransferase 1/2
MPSLLEYLSYNCNFMSILAGPACSYNDYMAFIEGSGYHCHGELANGKENGKVKLSEPSPKVRLL